MLEGQWVWVVCFADRLRGGEINDEFESARLLDGDVGCRGTVQYFVDRILRRGPSGQASWVPVTTTVLPSHDNRITGIPALRKFIEMPPPMVPAPITPTFLIGNTGVSSAGRVIVRSG